jgi:hypothetical protein
MQSEASQRIRFRFAIFVSHESSAAIRVSDLLERDNRIFFAVDLRRFSFQVSDRWFKTVHE